MKEMRNRGDNFLILCAAPGKRGLLSHPSFNLVPAQNHPPRYLPAFAQRSSEFNSQQFPGLVFCWFFLPCFSPRFLCLVFLPEKSTSSLLFPSGFFLFSLFISFLSHFLYLLMTPVLENSSLSGRKKVSSALLASSDQSKN